MCGVCYCRFHVYILPFNDPISQNAKDAQTLIQQASKPRLDTPSPGYKASQEPSSNPTRRLSESTVPQISQPHFNRRHTTKIFPRILQNPNPRESSPPRPDGATLDRIEELQVNSLWQTSRTASRLSSWPLSPQTHRLPHPQKQHPGNLN